MSSVASRAEPPPTCAGGVSQPPVERSLEPGRLGDHLDRLYRAAWALCGSRQDAEDLVQETFVNVLKRPRFLRDGNELGYLLRALRNTHANRYRAALIDAFPVGHGFESAWGPFQAALHGYADRPKEATLPRLRTLMFKLQ